MRQLAVALLAMLLAAFACGQVPVRGVVRDPSGATVVGAMASVRPTDMTANGVANEQQGWQSKTGIDGAFSITLPPGQYELCITDSGFVTNCKRFAVKEERSIALDFTLRVNPPTNLAPSSLMDNRLHKLSGVHAVNCGHIRIRSNPAKATACVLRQFQNGHPFVVRYDIPGVDSEVSFGLASNSQHEVYAIGFDSFGTSPEGLPEGSKLMDGNHNVILPCPVPVKLRVTATGMATCLATGNGYFW